MTAENNGTDPAPEGDDPFAYLYRQDGGDGSAQQQTGVPRRSYNQVRAVGERQYGERPQHNAYYAAPETMPGGRAATRQQGGPAAPPPQHGAPPHGGHGDGRDRGRRRNGLLAGALAVVAAVVIGIGVAVFFNNDGASQDQANGKDGSSGAAQQDQGGKQGQDKQQKTQQKLPKENAARLQLDGGATTAKDAPDPQSPNGAYVGNFNNPGASLTWRPQVPKAGQYKLNVRYSIPGEPADAKLVVNGKPGPKLGMDNFIKSPKGNWKKGWQTTWSPVTLQKGANTVQISCGEGNKCNANLGKVWLTPTS